MQWSDAPHGGFTTGTPWIETNPNQDRIDAADALADPDSIFAHYRTLSALRERHPVIVDGDYEPFTEDHPSIVAYVRRLGGERLAVLANAGGERARFEVPDGLEIEGECLVANLEPRASMTGTVTFEPWEALAVRVRSPGHVG